jgi:hypothetical protein
MYVRITVHVTNDQQRSGIRHFPDSEQLQAIRTHAFKLSVEVLGRRAIKNVRVEELPADDPGVVAFIISGKRGTSFPEPSTGEHPFTREQRRRPLH